ncbi:hypothetical protein [Cellulomonas sp. KRMCY2]|uniref:hypothetical protein n=1 Tax=Cellulomonas sp. KRMCY2 TaxID=1304865 RepID=UPI00045E65DD|nr:hypothetical protein [Cellulomonas sp. KRMCY2]
MNTSRTARFAAALALGAGLALALTGCSPTEAEAPTPRAEATALEPAPVEATVAPEVPVVAAPAVGAVITDAEVAAAEAAGLGVYTTATGELVVIDPAAPAPQVILDEAAASGYGATAAPDDATREARTASLLGTGERAAEAGKRLVFVVAGGQYGQDGTIEKVLYAVVTSATELRAPGGNADTIEGATAIAQARIDAQPDPAIYEIVVLAS